HRLAIRERGGHDDHLHRHVGGAGSRARRGGGAGDSRPAGRPPGGALAPVAGVGHAGRRDGEALRVALSPHGGPPQRRARRARAQLARRPASGAARRHPRGRVAHDALRRRALLRAPPGHPARALRGGAGGRRRPAGDARADHTADARADSPRGDPLPDARRPARLRPHVRADGRRPRGHDGDDHGVRLSGPLPDAPARLRVPPLLPSQLTLAHYRAVIERSLMPQALANSFGIATLTTLLALAVGVPGAYAVARLPLPGKRWLLLAIVASTAFPQIATV